MLNIRNFTYEELQSKIQGLNEKSYRASQIFAWLHKRDSYIDSYDMMTNVSKELRDTLKNTYSIDTVKISNEFISKIDETRKYLLELVDGNVIESVIMSYKYGHSICISTQVGCAMGCEFCASTKSGFIRNLETYEMLGEVYAPMINISNIVLMGSGEPLNNYDNVLKFINIINDEKGYNLGKRNITISTCGIVPNIIKLADDVKGVWLALSLHSAIEEKRKTIMKIAHKYSLEDTMLAIREYFLKTKRRLSLEYSLIKDLNDSMEDAKALCALCKKYLNDCEYYVNLIKVNPIKESNFTKPSDDNVLKFRDYLNDNGIVATIRRTLGEDISGSCGQLRNSYINSASN